MPSTVVRPTTSGMRAARPPKKISDSTMRSGSAKVSARARSDSTVSPSCSPPTISPPTVTASSSAKASRTASVTSPSSAAAASVPSTRERVPSSETSPAAASGGALAAETTLLMPSIAASRSVADSTWAGVAAGPSAAPTRRAMPGEGDSPVAAVMASIAVTDSASAGTKPPPSSSREPATDPPKNPARTTKRRRPASDRRGWRLRSCVREVMGPPSRRGVLPRVRPGVAVGRRPTPAGVRQGMFVRTGSSGPSDLATTRRGQSCPSGRAHGPADQRSDTSPATWSAQR